MKLRFLAGILLLGVCYTMVGKLALMLAIPPGYSTAIFPSAGIAVASILMWGYRVTPGVFLGSVLLNIWISLESTNLSYNSYIIATVVAIGATLQALLGAWAVQRFVGFPTTLTKEKHILLFMLLAGPLACLVNASVSVTSLLAFGIISHHEFYYSWFTWWVGDTIGVLIAAPLLFIMFSGTNQVWRQRRTSVAFPLIVTLSLVIFLFVGASKWELERLRFDFTEITNDTFDKLQSSFTGYVDAISAIERFFVSSSYVTREEFGTFVKKMLKDKPGIQGLSWNPLINQQQRLAFEKKVREEGIVEFTIKQRDETGNLIPAVQKDEYIVVHYIEPLQSNTKALGFDVSSNIQRLKAINKARSSNKPIATGGITLVQENENQTGFLLFYPVYKKHNLVEQPDSIDFKGFAVGVFRIGDIVSSALTGTKNKNIIVGIYDETIETDISPLFGPTDPASYSNTMFHSMEYMHIGGRKWSIHFWSSKEYLNSHSAWQAWTILVFGLLITSMFGAFLLAMTGRSYQLNVDVLERTKEIEQQKIKLMEVNKTLNTTINALELTNQELDQYAFIASHDLKSPLQSIFQLASWIEEDCVDILPNESKQHLILLRKRILRMEALLTDLLTFSRISREDYEIEQVNLKTSAEKAYSLNSIPSTFHLKTIKCDVVLTLPRIPVELMLRNLINNAVKHHNKDTGTITVSYRLSNHEHVITVADDGPGIPTHLHAKALCIFSTLQSRDKTEGSGLGLSMVKKAVERFDGRIEINSDGTNGTSISTYWPLY